MVLVLPGTRLVVSSAPRLPAATLPPTVAGPASSARIPAAGTRQPAGHPDRRTRQPGPGCPCDLETADPANVDFYQASGSRSSTRPSRSSPAVHPSAPCAAQPSSLTYNTATKEHVMSENVGDDSSGGDSGIPAIRTDLRSRTLVTVCRDSGVSGRRQTRRRRVWWLMSV
jgi:hypothetical protein